MSKKPKTVNKPKAIAKPKAMQRPTSLGGPISTTIDVTPKKSNTLNRGWY